MNTCGLLDGLGIFMESFGSAIGGFVGALLFFLWRWGKERARKLPQEIATYFPGDANKSGEGKLIYKIGQVLNDEAQLKTLKFDRSVFAISNDDFPTSTTGEKTIIYGPYSADLWQTGKFKIGFEIATSGFMSDDLEVLESVLLRLNVTQKSDVYGVKFLRYRDLQEMQNGKTIELNVYSNGTGIWEYRVLFPNNIYDTLTLLKKPLNPFKVYFKKTTVTYIPEVQMPW